MPFMSDMIMANNTVDRHYLKLGFKDTEALLSKLGTWKKMKQYGIV